MRTVLTVLAAHALTVTMGLAQTIGTGDLPRCFFWETAPEGWDDDEFDERFIPMVRVNVYAHTGTSAGVAVKAAVASLIAQFPGNESYIEDHICILLQNFGVTGPTRFDQDAVEEPEWITIEAPESQEQTHTPWLKTGSNAAKSWMDDFIEEIDNNPTFVPFEFAFDTEVPLCFYGFYNDVLLAEKVFDPTGATNDDRWDDPDWKIPYGDVSAKTLAEWWEDATTEYGMDWPADPRDMLDTDKTPNWYATGGYKNNRAFFLWYQRILDFAIEGAMRYSAYDGIASAWPSCKISNYASTKIPQGLTVNTATGFGWQFNFTTEDDTAPHPADSFLTRTLPLGYFKAENASYGHEDSGTYFITPGNYRYGTTSAPVLYQVHPHHNTSAYSAVIQKNVYLPHDGDCSDVGSACNAPCETDWESALRIHRHWLESLERSCEDSSDITPWVTLPGQPLFSQSLSAEDLSQQLCMLRAKSVPELYVWTNDTDYVGSHVTDWQGFAGVYKRVYAPTVYDVNTGAGYSSSYDEETVRRTLLVADEPYQYELESMYMSPDYEEATYAAAVDVTFTHMDLHTGQDLQVILESSITLDYEDDIPVLPGEPIFTRLLVWDPDQVMWLPLDAPDSGVTAALSLNIPEGAMGFYTPDYSARRILSFHDCRVRQIAMDYGELIIRAAFFSEVAFSSAVDLMQIYWSGSTELEECGEAMRSENSPPVSDRASGADFDFNGVLNELDAAGFAAAYLEELPCADMDRDGFITAADAMLFYERFGG